MAPSSTNSWASRTSEQCQLSTSSVELIADPALHRWPGFFEFTYCQTELSATPLLDVQVKHGLAGGPNLQSITIVGFRPDDTVAPNYLGKYPDLVTPGCACL